MDANVSLPSFASILRCVAAVVLFSMAAGCDKSPNTARMPAADLFRLHCSGCHGNGDGNGHVASSLGVKPRDFTQSDWHQTVSDSHIRKAIEQGGAAVRKSDKMPAFSDKLRRVEVDTLVEYVRSLKRGR